MEIPQFNTKKEKIDWLIDNKSTLISQKTAATKYADGIYFNPSNVFTAYNHKGASNATKAIGDSDELIVKAAINTSNFLDSHDDVHIKGLWSKSIKENKNIMHLQEHKLEFNKIIADSKDLKVKAEDMSWKDLGFNYDGTTQVLLFESTVKRDRNPFMYKQYSDGNVKNHSVGMRYVKIELGVDDEDFEDEYKVWKKYIDEIANKDRAIEQGFFWAVKEAKVIEGSAVPIGSNTATPTIEVNEPEKSTQIEPLKDTQIDVNELKTIIKNALK